MNKLWKFLQYGYLVIAIIFLIEAIVGWNTDRDKSYIMIGFSIFITLVFFFKRHFRKKVQQRNNQKS
jgi:hypothetical protein